MRRLSEYFTPLRHVGPRAAQAAAIVAGALLLLPLTPTRSEPPPLGTVVRGFRSPGDYPEGLAWDGQYLWSNNFSNGTLYKVDPADGRTLAQFSGGYLPTQPEGLAWDGQHLWTCDWRSGVILKFLPTPQGMQLVDFFGKPENSGPNVGLGWDGTYLWLTCHPGGAYTFGQLYKIDPTTHEVVWSKELDVYYVEDLAWDGRYLWCAEWLNSFIFAIDPATGATLHRFGSPGPNPVGAAWDGAHLWVSCTTKDSLWALDVSAANPVVVDRRRWGDIKDEYRLR